MKKQQAMRAAFLSLNELSIHELRHQLYPNIIISKYQFIVNNYQPISSFHSSSSSPK